MAAVTMKTNEMNAVDFLVVGCGIAGLRAAIEVAARGRVLILAKSELSDSATEWAQGGIAAALSDDDEVSLHEQDTIQAGDGLCNPEAVRVLVEEGPARIHELIEWGTQFDRAGTKLAFTREAAHSRSRILYAHGDSTGHEISRALFAKLRSLENVTIRSHAFTTELLVEAGRVAGLRFLDEASGTLHEVRASAVLLATGGLGQVYPETTNPPVATGDGMAIAYRAGAVLSDLEFVQFHPTALAVAGAPHFLLSEALRGEGGILRNVALVPFMKQYHEAAELAPRDVVARAITCEMQRTNASYVYLDMTAKNAEALRNRFPRIYETCKTYGVDITTQMIPVRPAAHYAMGGVRTDLRGHTTLPGLFAAGETAATGVHGANRLASNSLLEGLVFGARAGVAMVEGAGRANPRTAVQPATSTSGTALDDSGHADSEQLEQVRSILWKDVGIIRSGEGLARAIQQLDELNVAQPAHPSRQGSELHNMWTLARLIARSALAREESRGSHYRSDFPARNDATFQKHSHIAVGKKVWFE